MASQETDISIVDRRVDWSKYSKRVVLKTILCRSDRGLGLIGERIVIGGWVKSFDEQVKDISAAPSLELAKPRNPTPLDILQSRIPVFLQSIFRVLVGGNVAPPPPEEQSNVVTVKNVSVIAYLRVNDGSCVPSLQVVIDSSVSPPSNFMAIGTSILAEGVLKQPSTPGKYVIELKVENILHVGTVDPANYPLTKRRISLEILRSYPHFRPRTTVVASVTRIRNALSYATHTFFQNHGFLYVQMPVITTTDCGSGEMFHVTRLFRKAHRIEDPTPINDSSAVNLEVVRAAIKEKRNIVQELKRSDSNKEALVAALQDLQKTNELAVQLEAREKPKYQTLLKGEKLDFSEDYFSRQVYLMASGQFHLESYACALSSVYTFGPVFQAENSQSNRRLAEMWMVEVEMAFAELEDVMNCAEDYLKFLCQRILEHCSADMNFLSEWIDKSSIHCLESVASSPFTKITYSEAVEVLKKVTHKTFKTKIEWGVNLADEHASYLVDEIYKRPVIIYNYPKEVKPFYMRINDDGETVAAIDIVVPKAGVLIRGSQREERFDVISSRIQELGLPREQYEWYLDLRKHGTVKHSGFSLRFEHMVMFATGLEDVRDAIPFPRTRGNANY